MNNELKPFDVQKEFADNGFTFFTKNLILCSGNTTENNAMTIGWGGIGNYLGHDRPAVTVYVAPARYTWEFMERHNRFTIMEFEDQLYISTSKTKNVYKQLINNPNRSKL